MDVNIANDVKGINVLVVPTNVEQEDAAKPQVPPVPHGGETDTVKLNDQTRRGKAQQDEVQNQGRLTPNELEEAVKEIQQRFQAMGSNFKFGLYNDLETNNIVAQLRDNKTNEVIKQFPPEEVLKLRKKLKDLIGLLFDEKV